MVLEIQVHVQKILHNTLLRMKVVPHQTVMIAVGRVMMTMMMTTTTMMMTTTMTTTMTTMTTMMANLRVECIKQTRM